MMRLALALSLGGLAVAGAGALHGARADDATQAMMRMSVAQSDYIENCGGCHGFDGDSAPADIPVLKQRVGYFMCTSRGRDYLVRLPNVAHSRIEDPQELADLVNFVVFAIGGASTPKNAERFTAREVSRLRRQPLDTVSLVAEREAVVAALPAACGAPASLGKFYPGQNGPNQIAVPSAIPLARGS